jgi:hypothetical protein
MERYKMADHQSETITNLVAKYELPLSRHVEIRQLDDGAYFATVAQGDNVVSMSGFKKIDRAIDWARQQFPELDITGKEISQLLPDKSGELVSGATR